MVDIFDEVEEDLRAERAQRLFRRYGWLLLVLVVAVVGATLAWQFRSRALSQADAAAAARYVAIINAVENGAPGDTHADQIPALDQLAATAPEGYRTLARLRAAGLKANGGDLPGAQALWNQVAGDPAADHLLRDFATLMATQHDLDQGSPDQLQARLKPIVTPDNPWSALAREQLAILDLRLGKTDEARQTLKALSVDFLAPAGVRSRASALLAGLGPATTT